MSRRSSHSADELANDALAPVYVSKHFKKGCIDAVQRALDCSRIVPQRAESSRGDLWFLKEPETATIALDADAGGIPVTPVGRGRRQTHLFWIAPGYRLGSNPEIIEHATIRLYKGGLPGDQKHLVARGEWEFRETQAAIAKGHAQPHWHFHAVETGKLAAADPAAIVAQLGAAPPDRRETLVSDLMAPLQRDAGTDLGVVSTTNDPGCAPRLRNPEGLHFPMAAHWAALPLACRESDRTEEAIHRWFQGVIAYIRRQIELAAER